MPRQEEKSEPRNYRERGLAAYFTRLILAFLACVGALLIYRVENPLHDLFLGMMLGVFIYTIAIRYLRPSFSHDAAIKQLIRHHRDSFDFSAFIRNPNLLYYAVPIAVLPLLIYQQGFPLRYILFGTGTLFSLVSIYLIDLQRSTAFFKRLEPYIDWKTLETVEGRPGDL